MKGFGDHRVPIIGQVTFWYQARRFAKKKLVKALVSDTETREILLSADIIKVGMYSSTLSLPTTRAY